MTSPAQPSARPAWHLTARSGWINDPLGLTFRDGLYHVFFQHVPGVPEWDLGCHWGHATSPDLLSWTERPVALAPGEGDDGCWSGSIAVPPGGPAVLFYTSVGLPDLDLGRARVAHPLDDRWDTWSKGAVVADPPDEPGLVVFRDPCVFRDGASWRMLVGGALAGGTATALAYTSTDLTTWRYDGRLASRHTSETDGAWTGKGWECPQVFPVDGEHVLVVSVWEPEAIRDVACAVGTYEDGRFTPRSWQQLTAGGHYAASAFTDRDGRPCVIFWIRDVGDTAQGWMGALSVPYVLTIDEGRVRLTPHPAVPARRGQAGEGVAAAFDAAWTPAGPGSVLVLRAGDGSEAAVLTAGDGVLDVVRPGAPTLSLRRGAGEVRVLVDGPVLEVVTDRQVAGGPLAAGADGVRPEGDGELRWWRLTEPAGADA